MQIDGKIATVYAGALFELVAEEKELEQFNVALSDLQQSLMADKRVWDFLSSPVADPDDKIKVVKKCLQGRAYPALVNFMCLLAGRHRFDALSGICVEFSALVDAKLGRRKATVATAHKLSDADLVGIKKVLSDYFKKDIEVETELAPELIGGLVINAGNLVIDTSVKSKLKSIRKQLLDQKIFGENFYEN